VSAVDAAGSIPGVVIRPLQTWDDYAACFELQRIVWGEDPRELVPPIVLEVTRRAGGVLGGAFDGEGDLLGFVYGMPALHDGRPAHWSHLLAVRPDARRRGLGEALKRWQRDRVREAGIDRAYWTYEPLLAANAYFNLNVLGARAMEYVVDFYGAEIKGTAGSDRLVVEWDLTGGAPAPVGPAGEVLDPGAADLPDLPRLGLAVPADFARLAREDPSAALAWREWSRRVFTHYLGAGYRVAGFAGGTPPHYVLEADG
jgi:chorismate synthase